MRIDTPTKIQHKIVTLEKKYQLLNYYNSDDEASRENLLSLKAECLRYIDYYQDVAFVLSAK